MKYLDLHELFFVEFDRSPSTLFCTRILRDTNKDVSWNAFVWLCRDGSPEKQLDDGQFPFHCPGHCCRPASSCQCRCSFNQDGREVSIYMQHMIISSPWSHAHLQKLQYTIGWSDLSLPPTRISLIIDYWHQKKRNQSNACDSNEDWTQN